MGSLSDTVVERLRATVRDDTFAGRFEILSEAGAGGMGRVFEAIQRADQGKVALKIVTGRSRDDHARFSAEAEILERLDHPAIVRYVGHGVTSDGDAYIAMAWLDGETLSARLRRGKLSIDDATTIGARIALALDHAHDAGVIHRDVKPSNIFLVGGDPARAMLIDFGVAKGTANITMTGQLIGTPGYMAPEQALGQRRVDGRVDLFALGTLLYEMLSGRPPFVGDQVLEVLARVLLHDPERLVDVPPRLAALVQSLLAKEPSRRQADAGAVATELTAIHAALIAGDRAALGSRRTWPWIAATAAAALGVGLYWWWPATASLSKTVVQDASVPAMATPDAPAAAAMDATALATTSPAAPAPKPPAPVAPPRNSASPHAPGGLDGTYVGVVDEWAQPLAPKLGRKDHLRHSTSQRVVIREHPVGTLVIGQAPCETTAKRDDLQGIIQESKCTSSGNWRTDDVRGSIEVVPGKDGKLSITVERVYRDSADLGSDDRKVHATIEYTRHFVGERVSRPEIHSSDQ